MGRNFRNLEGERTWWRSSGGIEGGCMRRGGMGTFIGRGVGEGKWRKRNMTLIVKFRGKVLINSSADTDSGKEWN